MGAAQAVTPSNASVTSRHIPMSKKATGEVLEVEREIPSDGQEEEDIYEEEAEDFPISKELEEEDFHDAVDVFAEDSIGLSAEGKEEREDALIAALPTGGRAFLGKNSYMLSDLGYGAGGLYHGGVLGDTSTGN